MEKINDAISISRTQPEVVGNEQLGNEIRRVLNGGSLVTLDIFDYLGLQQQVALDSKYKAIHYSVVRLNAYMWDSATKLDAAAIQLSRLLAQSDHPRYPKMTMHGGLTPLMLFRGAQLQGDSGPQMTTLRGGARAPVPSSRDHIQSLLFPFLERRARRV